MNPTNDLTTIQTQQIARFERNVEISITGLNYSFWTFCVFLILLWFSLKTQYTRHTKNSDLKNYEENIVLVGFFVSLVATVGCLIAYFINTNYLFDWQNSPEQAFRQLINR